MGTSYRAEVSKKNKYWISKHRFYEISHHCMQYNEWKDEYRTLSAQGVKAVQYDGMPHGTTVGQPTETIGLRLAELRNKIESVERAAEETDPFFAKFILKAVTNEGITYNYLREIMDMPCDKNKYTKIRRKFYWIMGQKM